MYGVVTLYGVLFYVVLRTVWCSVSQIVPYGDEVQATYGAVRLVQTAP